MKDFKNETNPILRLTFDFALDIIAYCKILDEIKQYQLSKQLFKSGTSIGANSNEAQHAESKADFIHKFKIAAKEMQETSYWLALCKYSDGYPNADHLIDKLNEVEKVINKIIATTRKNHPISYFLSLFLF